MNSDFRRNFWIVLGAHVVVIALLFLLGFLHRQKTETVTWLDGGANHAAQSASAEPTPPPDVEESPTANHEPKKSQPEETPKMTVSEREKLHRIEPPSEIAIPTPTPRVIPVVTPKSTPQPTPTPLSIPIPTPTPKETPTPNPTPDLQKIEAEKRRQEHLAELKREREKERAEEKARAAEKEREAEKAREEAAEKRKREEWLKEQESANATPTPNPKPKSTPSPTPHHHTANHEVANGETKPQPKASPEKTPEKSNPKATPKTSSGEHDDSANDETAKAARAKFLKSQGEGTANDEGSAAGSGGGDRGGAGHKNGGKKASDFGEYWAKLKDRFDERWEQPTSIIKSDQQFVTTVHFRIAKDGTILNASLAHSSGMSIMDESVMSAARQVKKVDPLPEGLTNGDYYDININFQLHNQ